MQRAMRQLEHLAAMAEQARAVMATADEEICEAVREARERGASWAQIGRCFHLSRQAAYKRWAHR